MQEHGHLQLSAVSLYLLYLVKMIFSGLQIIYNTDVVVELLSPVQLFCDAMNLACHTSLSMGFFRQVYFSGLPYPTSGDLPNSGIEPESLALLGRVFTTEPPGKPITLMKSL